MPLHTIDERFRCLFEEAPIAYHEIDPDGIVVRVNRAECELLGFTAAQMVGHPIWQFVAPESQEESQEAIRQKMSGSLPLAPFEREYLRRDGVILILKIYENHIAGGGGAILGMRSALMDVTEQRRHEQELARSNAELEQFAYVASHDLQEPLRMITSYTQLLARRYRGKIDADADEFIHYAVDGASRMQALINDLLMYSRVDRKGGELQLTDPEAILNRALENLTVAIAESQAVVAREPLPMIMADATQLGQLFQNLIGNAIKFHQPGVPPHVQIRAFEGERGCEFSIRDNGIGIDPKYSERIFQIFQRLHSRAEYPGTGIGLAVCRKIVERHGGRLWVESQPGSGSDFHFIIPTRG